MRAATRALGATLEQRPQEHAEVAIREAALDSAGAGRPRSALAPRALAERSLRGALTARRALPVPKETPAPVRALEHAAERVLEDSEGDPRLRALAVKAVREVQAAREAPDVRAALGRAIHAVWSPERGSPERMEPVDAAKLERARAQIVETPPARLGISMERRNTIARALADGADAARAHAERAGTREAQAARTR